MITYVITLSQHFPSTHKRKGEATNFEDKFRRQIKLHTIRANYTLWAKRFEKIAAGDACLSVREWMGAPYRSKQREIVRLTREDGIGIQRLDIANLYGCDRFIVDCYDVALSSLAINDGLSIDDWREWFKDYELSQPMAIIHFTPFRY